MEFRRRVALGMAVVLAGACGPAPAVAPSTGAERPPAATTAPKVLTIGLQREPNTLHRTLTQGVPAVGGVNQIFHIPHDYLVVPSDSGGVQPQLAAELVSAERGTWRLNADGTMDTVWKLRPNIRWHDGTLFTADDLVFSFEVYKDREIPNAVGRPLQSMTSAAAADPQTFAIRWSESYVLADDMSGLVPMSRHLLEDLYLIDKLGFPNSARFTTDFVGLGPYRFARWDRHLEIQHRAEFQQPRNGFTATGVRQGFFHAIDRDALVEVVTERASPTADSYYPPTHYLRPAVEAAIPQFPHDLARAQQLVQQAGWARGPDGILVHGTTGERFEILLYGSNSPFVEKEQNVIANGWKAIGAQVNFHIIPTALGGDREYRSKLPGAGLNGTGHDDFFLSRLHSRFITSDANRWNGGNRGGFSDPRVDALLDRIVATIPVAGGIPLHRELLQIQIGEVALMPLYWDIDPALALRGVKGVAKKSGSVATWNMFEWDKE